MDFFESVFGWNLDAGSGAAEWLVVAGVGLAVIVGALALLRRVLGPAIGAKRAPRPARVAHLARVALTREG